MSGAKKQRVQWSAEEDDRLTELYMAGRSWGEISRALGRTRSACSARGLSHLSLRRKRDQARIGGAGTPMQRAASTPGNLAHALYSEDAPYCDAGCGDHATVRMEHVGLCDEHAADTIRETLEPLLGKRCCRINRDGEGNLTVCLTTYGVEHAHG